MDREALQVSHRRISRTKIINGQMDTHSPNLVQRFYGLLRIFHHHAFGYLKFKICRLDSRVCDRCLKHLQQVALEKLSP